MHLNASIISITSTKHLDILYILSSDNIQFVFLLKNSLISERNGCNICQGLIYKVLHDSYHPLSCKDVCEKNNFSIFTVHILCGIAGGSM